MLLGEAHKWNHARRTLCKSEARDRAVQAARSVLPVDAGGVDAEFSFPPKTAAIATTLGKSGGITALQRSDDAEAGDTYAAYALWVVGMLLAVAE